MNLLTRETVLLLQAPPGFISRLPLGVLKGKLYWAYSFISAITEGNKRASILAPERMDP